MARALVLILQFCSACIACITVTVFYAPALAHRITHIPRIRFPHSHEAKLTAVIGTTLRYPMLRPTKKPLHPPRAHTSRAVSRKPSQWLGRTRPPTCWRRRMTSKGYETVCAVAPETAPMSRSATGWGLDLGRLGGASVCVRERGGSGMKIPRR